MFGYDSLMEKKKYGRLLNKTKKIMIISEQYEDNGYQSRNISK
jgi:uncharacterized protein (UPF0128 family)